LLWGVDGEMWVSWCGVGVVPGAGYLLVLVSMYHGFMLGRTSRNESL
jgi:hypothetical protein